MISPIENQKRVSKAIQVLVSIFFLVSQISLMPVYAAEPLLTQDSTGNLVPVTNPNATSTQKQSQTQTQTQTSTQFMSEGPLSPAAEQVTTTKPARSNSNFEFEIAEKSNREKDISVKDRRTGESTLVTTVQPEENYETKIGPVDVNAEGTHAMVNIQRNYTGNLGYSSVVMNKGTTLLFDIAKKTLVEPELIDAFTGQSLGKGSIPGQLLNTSSYRFVDGLLLLNGTGRHFNGHFFIDQFDPFVVNLTSNPPRATELNIQQWMYLQNEIVFTSQKDKLLFGATQRSNNSIAIYDVATGKVDYQRLSTHGFGGIRAVSPDGEYAIAASSVDAVYVIPVRNLAETAKTINMPVPAGGGPSSLVKAKFLDPTTVELVMENGKHYLLNIKTLTFTESTGPSLPDGWTRTATDSSYAFRVMDDSGPLGGANKETHLLNLLTHEDMIVGAGSAVRHNPFLVDTDGQVVLVAYHESGPIVGNLSWVELHRLSDLKQDPINGYLKAERTVAGVYQSHQFQGGNVIVNTEVYNTATPDPNDTRIQTVTIPLSEILTSGISVKLIDAPSNSNYVFKIVSMDGAQKEVRLKNRQTGESTLIATLKPGETVGPMDVNPEGTYAFANIQRKDAGPLADGKYPTFIDTGDVLVFDIAQKKIVQVESVNPSTGQSLGLATIQGRVIRDYEFRDGILLFNTYTTNSFTGMSGYRAAVVNLASSTPRYTKTTLTGISLGSEVFTPQKDKLIFGGESHGVGTDNAIGIYDVATGAFAYQTLPNFGFGGIKAISPDGNFAIAASAVNTVYVVPIRGTTGGGYVFIPVPSNQGPFAYSLKRAKFLSKTLVELTLENGKKYILDITHKTLKKVSPPPPPAPNPPPAPAKPLSPLDLLKNLQNQLLGRLR